MAIQRILILGMSGAGKSTLARQLGHRLGLPVTHLDNLAHEPGWVLKPEAALTAAFTQLAAQPAWVVDGNYFRMSPALRQRAELILFLDFSTLYCLGQILRRWLSHQLGIKRRQDLVPGLEDTMRMRVLWWVWRWRRDNRPRWLTELATLPADKVLSFRNRKAVQAWLATLPPH